MIVKHGLFISLAASFPHTLPLEQIANIYTYNIYKMAPFPPLGKGKGGDDRVPA
jgi:hypothetical protein